MSPTLRVQLLGDLSIWQDEAPVTGVDTPRLQSLLAYLLLHRDAPQARSRLAFLFWPDSTEAQARTNLRKQILYLRRALPQADRFLYIDSKVVQWQPDAPFTLDVADLESALTEGEKAEAARNQAALREALEQAVALYQGDLLPGHYDDWVLTERDRLRERYVEALERLILLLEHQRDYPAAIQQAQRLLRHDPLHEATSRRLMRLHALNGDRARALRAYHTCATTLQRELGVQPTEATLEAYERLLRLEARPMLPRERLVPTAPLVGRDGEWAQLREAWRAASRGRPHLVLLAGEVGIGKTRLAEELLEWANHQGVPTASARCYASEGGLAYAPLAAWLRTEALQPALSSLEEVWLSEVARLLPELLVERPDLPPPAPLTESWQRQRLFEGLARPFLAQGQLLLLLDDMQWCDRETLEWLPYLLRSQTAAMSQRTRPTQLLVVSTARAEEMGDHGRLTVLLNDLRRERQLTEIELRPLAEAETAALATDVAGQELAPELTTELYRETEGNPLFVIETVRAGVLARDRRTEGGGPATPSRRWLLPPAVHEAISARLSHLSPNAREMVRVAATIGREFTYGALAHACECDEDALVQALDELWQRHIVREQGADAYDFSHDKIREVAYSELSSVRRRFLHRRVAAALEMAYADPSPGSGQVPSPSLGRGLDAVAGQIAAHFERGGLPQQAAPYYRRAAAVAQRVHANEEAIDYYQHLLTNELAQELSATDTCAVMLDLAEVWRLTGQWAEAEATLRQALELIEATDDLTQRARCQQALGDVRRLQGEYDEALQWLEKAGDDYLAANDRQGVVRVFWTIGEVHWYKGDHAMALAALERQLDVADDIGDERGMADAASTMGMVYWSQGDLERARVWCERSIALASEIGHQWTLGRALITMGNIYSSRSDSAEAWIWYQQALDVAGRSGDRQCAGWAVTNLGNLCAAQGDLRDALACYEYELENKLEIGDRWSASIALANMAEAQVTQGYLRQAERLYSRAIALGRSLKMNYLHNYLCSLAEFYAQQERYREAQALNDEALVLAGQSEGERMGGEDVLFRARVLDVRLRVALEQVDVPTALRELEQMGDAALERKQQAMLCYELWRLDPSQDRYRRQAADLYHALYSETPDVDCRQRYQELTGDLLPEPPQLPDLPEEIQRRRVDTEALLARVDNVIAELAE